VRSAVVAVDAARAVNQVSLVWTGPPTTAVGLRYTRSVLHSLVANARESLVIVSFAGYKVDDLVARLAEAVDRGVTVSLVLETHADSGGDLSVDAAAAFASLAGSVRFYRWPLEAREAVFGPSAKLHAKCVIADRSAALITSANLTSAGINDNIELGVLIEAGPLPAELHDHLDLLVEDGTLTLIG
jgi:phosphatidylserine/phosphatidylglycerophosphate/cardiolipin synthase-like enzyme